MTETGTARILAFDFGGTKLAVALVDPESLEPVEKSATPTPADASLGLAAALELADELIARTQPTISAVGVSFGGHVDSESGIVRRSVHIPGWENVPLARILRQRYGVPVAVHNDGTAGAVGEWATGAGSGMTNLVYLTISTGVGGGLIVGGLPFEGRGLAAEFGHLPTPDGRDACTCGLFGCLETVAAGPAIAREAARRIAEGEATALTQPSPTAADVAALARHGDTLSVALLASAGRAVGSVVSMIWASFDPDGIIIGGGVSESGDAFWNALREAVCLPFGNERAVNVVPAAHRRDAPLRGAAALARGR